jgi:hypothetical protein
MNRELQRKNSRRKSARKHGGGYGMGTPLVAQPSGPGSDFTFAVKQPINQGYDDCAFPARPGQLFTTPNPDAAQAPMVGGGPDAIEATHSYPYNGWNQSLVSGTAPATSWGRDTGLVTTVGVGGSRTRRANKRKGSRRIRGGGCGCTGGKLFGGARRRRYRTVRKHRGGGNGYAIDPSASIGGSGPNVDALRTSVPCDPRAGVIDSSAPLDPRAYGVGYSATPNTTLPSLQAGGAYSTGNAYPDSCYKATGSSLPVYEAQTAGFNFYPSTAVGGTLPDGVTPFTNVVPYAARMGGARRKSRKGRKNKSRKSQRKH